MFINKFKKPNSGAKEEVRREENGWLEPVIQLISIHSCTA